MPPKTICATFTKYGSGTSEAVPVKGNQVVNTYFIGHKSSNLFTLYGLVYSQFCSIPEVFDGLF